MEKGDCFVVKTADVYFALILYSSGLSDGKLFHNFMVLGGQYATFPTLESIESGKVLGYKFVNKTSDLINTISWMDKKHDPSVLYNGVRYDLLTIPDLLFATESNNIQHIGRVDIHERFAPRPEFLVCVSNYEKLIEIISERISKRDPTKVEWDRFYDAFELGELLKKENNTR